MQHEFWIIEYDDVDRVQRSWRLTDSVTANSLATLLNQFSLALSQANQTVGESQNVTTQLNQKVQLAERNMLQLQKDLDESIKNNLKLMHEKLDSQNPENSQSP